MVLNSLSLPFCFSDATKVSNPEPFSEDFSTEETMVDLIPEEEGGKVVVLISQKGPVETADGNS